MQYHWAFSWRKARLLAAFLGHSVEPLRRDTQPSALDEVFVWGDAVAPASPARIIRVEDGFLRSAGLGAAFARPVSWVFDAGGLHHDASAPTQLEELIGQGPFDAPLLARAAALRELIVGSGMTKYNVGNRAWSPQPPFARHTRKVLVVGQVAGDAALRSITSPVRTNLALLSEARRMNPHADIVYKRHPDVVAGLREGDDSHAESYCNMVVEDASISALLPHVDEVHVLTSLAGFEALLHGKHVVCHGQPFYAGWGLTEDRFAPPRRTVRRTLDELVAAALILYPLYRDPRTGQRVSVEAAIDYLLAERDRSPSLVEQLRARAGLAIGRWRHQVEMANLMLSRVGA